MKAYVIELNVDKMGMLSILLYERTCTPCYVSFLWLLAWHRRHGFMRKTKSAWKSMKTHSCGHEAVVRVCKQHDTRLGSSEQPAAIETGQARLPEPTGLDNYQETLMSAITGLAQRPPIAVSLMKLRAFGVTWHAHYTPSGLHCVHTNTLYTL